MNIQTSARPPPPAGGRGARPPRPAAGGPPREVEGELLSSSFSFFGRALSLSWLSFLEEEEKNSDLFLPELHRRDVRQRQAERQPPARAGGGSCSSGVRGRGSGVDPLGREREVAVFAERERAPRRAPRRRRHLLDRRPVPRRRGERPHGLERRAGDADELRGGRGAGGGRDGGLGAAVGGAVFRSGGGGGGGSPADGERASPRSPSPAQRGDLRGRDLDRGAGTAAAAAPGLSPDDAGGSAAEDAVGRFFFGGGGSFFFSR